MAYFDQLAARLEQLGLDDYGTAAVSLGDQWVVVNYNVDGRIDLIHSIEGVPTYAEYTGLGEVPEVMVDLLDSEERWVQLAHPEG